jgi:hypothetical protein
VAARVKAALGQAALRCDPISRAPRGSATPRRRVTAARRAKPARAARPIWLPGWRAITTTAYRHRQNATLHPYRAHREYPTPIACDRVVARGVVLPRSRAAGPRRLDQMARASRLRRLSGRRDPLSTNSATPDIETALVHCAARRSNSCSSLCEKQERRCKNRQRFGTWMESGCRARLQTVASPRARWRRRAPEGAAIVESDPGAPTPAETWFDHPGSVFRSRPCTEQMAWRDAVPPLPQTPMEQAPGQWACQWAGRGVASRSARARACERRAGRA